MTGEQIQGVSTKLQSFIERLTQLKTRVDAEEITDMEDGEQVALDVDDGDVIDWVVEIETIKVKCEELTLELNETL